MSKSLIREKTKEELQEIISNSTNINEALRKIGYKYLGGTNHNLFKQVCEELNIDYSHFTGITKNNIKRNEENVFCENSTASQTTLKNWYLKGKYSEYKCSICGINEWNNKPLVLRLDHINGINGDNRLDNLRWICPNCDSQLETFCRGHKYIRPKEENHNYCQKCGKEISQNATYCVECAHLISRIVERPSREELKNLIRNKPFVQIAKQYGVSDKAITKWCVANNLPSRKKDINNISDEEWINI